MFLKFILKKSLSIFFSIIKIFIRKKNYIIIQSYNPYSYSENSKYLFEYMSRHQSHKFKIYWNTNSKIISNFLKKKNLNYINIKKNPLKFLYIFLSAKIIIDSGTKFLDFLGLASSDLKVLKICIYHGGGPKLMPISKKITKERQKNIQDHKAFNFINFPSSFVKNKCQKNFDLDVNKVLSLGYPRCDQFFKKKKKKIFKYITGHDKHNSKVILYTPTWRGYKYSFPLNYMKGINYNNLNNFLKKNDLFFFYSCHPNQKNKNIPLKFSRIKFINIKKLPFYDTNEFLNEVDLLLNDYSASSTDFVILKKPQIFFIPDYKRYDNHQGFLDNYKKNLIGPEVNSMTGLKKKILKYSNSPKEYNNEFRLKIKNYTKKYYNLSIKNSSKLLKDFVVSKLDY